MATELSDAMTAVWTPPFCKKHGVVWGKNQWRREVGREKEGVGREGGEREVGRKGEGTKVVDVYC